MTNGAAVGPAGRPAALEGDRISSGSSLMHNTGLIYFCLPPFLRFVFPFLQLILIRLSQLQLWKGSRFVFYLCPLFFFRLTSQRANRKVSFTLSSCFSLHATADAALATCPQFTAVNWEEIHIYICSPSLVQKSVTQFSNIRLQQCRINNLCHFVSRYSCFSSQ